VYNHWKDEWQQAELASAEALARKGAVRASEVGRERDAMAQELARQRLDYERQLEALRSEKGALENKLASLKKVYERDREQAVAETRDALVAEKNKRIEALRGGFARRLLSRSISQGFNAWASQIAERNAMNAHLRRSVGRLTRPRLAATFTQWQSDWHGSASFQRFNPTSISKEVELQQKLAKAEKERDHLAAECRRIAQESELRTQEAHMAAIGSADDRKAMLAMTKELTDLRRNLFEARDADAHSRAARKQVVALTVALEETVDGARKQREGSEAALRRMLEEQRAAFEARLKAVQADHEDLLEAAMARRTQLEHELYEARLKDAEREKRRDEYRPDIALLAAPRGEHPRHKYTYQWSGQTEKRAQQRRDTSHNISEIAKFQPQCGFANPHKPRAVSMAPRPASPPGSRCISFVGADLSPGRGGPYHSNYSNGSVGALMGNGHMATTIAPSLS